MHSGDTKYCSRVLGFLLTGTVFSPAAAVSECGDAIFCISQRLRLLYTHKDTALAYFEGIVKEIEKVGSIHVIGALSLNTKHLKKHLRDDCNGWTVRVGRTIMFALNACSFLQLTIFFLLSVL